MGTGNRSDAGATERLATFAVDTGYDDLPKDVRQLLRCMISDTVGVAIAASDASPQRSVLDAAGRYRSTTPMDGPTASVIGTREKTDPALVALVVGINAHTDDFDDVHETMLGHPSAPVLAAILPIAECRGASGRDFLRAFAIGVEVETRLGEAINPTHYERGWHPTATLGTVGAAVAVGALFDFDSEELRRTIGIACSQAGGIKANFGTAVKPYHVGRAARCGIEAAHMAAAGVSASTDALERDFGGYLELFGANEAAVESVDVDAQSGDWLIIDPAVAFKPYPCCRSTHAPIDAALAIHEEWEDRRPEVARIDVIEHPQRIPHTNRPAPWSATDAKFSVQYCTSLALARGEVWLTDFDEDAITDPNRRRYVDDVTVHSDDALSDWGATVRVTMTDERIYEHSVDAPRGSQSRPLSDNELRRKFRRCVEPSLSPQAAERALRLIRSLETVDDVGTMVEALVPEEGDSNRESEGQSV